MKKVLWTLLLFVLGTTLVNAAGFGMSVGSSYLTKGGGTTLRICGDGVTGRFNISNSNAGVISVAAGSVWIENNCTEAYVSALNPGSATITVTSADTSDSSGNPINLGSKSITINVSLPREKSTNNNLKSLEVEGYEISPKFDANTLEYTVIVPNTVDKVNIKAVKADGYASITGNGEFEVTEGANEFIIVVTSETRVEKKYKVTVTVEDLNPIDVTVDGKKATLVKNLKGVEAPENYEETTIKIGSETLPGFTNKKTGYKLVGLKDSTGKIALYIYKDNKYTKYVEIKDEGLTIVPLDSTKELKGYKLKDITINEDKVKAYVVNDNSKFAIVYGMNALTGEKAYYSYDIKNNTLSKYDDELILSLQSKSQKLSYIMLGACALSVIFFITTISLAASNGKKKKLIKMYEELENARKQEVKAPRKGRKAKEEKVEEPKVEKVEEVKEEPKEEEPVKEEVKDVTEVYDIFGDDKKKKKSKK